MAHSTVLRRFSSATGLALFIALLLAHANSQNAGAPVMAEPPAAPGVVRPEHGGGGYDHDAVLQQQKRQQAADVEYQQYLARMQQQVLEQQLQQQQIRQNQHQNQYQQQPPPQQQQHPVHYDSPPHHAPPNHAPAHHAPPHAPPEEFHPPPPAAPPEHHLPPHQAPPAQQQQHYQQPPPPPHYQHAQHVPVENQPPPAPPQDYQHDPAAPPVPPHYPQGRQVAPPMNAVPGNVHIVHPPQVHPPQWDDAHHPGPAGPPVIPADLQERLVREDMAGEKLPLNASSDHVVHEWEKIMENFLPDQVLTFRVTPGEGEYFHIDVTELGTIIRGGFFESTDNKPGHAAFTAVSPKGQIVYSSKTGEGVFMIEGKQLGTYTFGVSLTGWSSNKYVTVVLGTGSVGQVTTQDLDTMEGRIKSIYSLMSTVESQTNWLWSREVASLKRVNSTANQTYVTLLIEMLCTVIATLGSVFALKRTVSKRSSF